jgi:CheY-like chemotaxis protein
VLIVDDDPDFVETYQDILKTQGYEAVSASSRAEAKRRLSEQEFDAVILDQKLQGRDGPDDGIDLLGEAELFGAKVLLATGYASDEAIQRAFALGVYDYIEKTPRIATLLRLKLRNIMELLREREVSTIAPSAVEDVIRSHWAALQIEKDSNIKGRLLEELLLLIFRSINGFEKTIRSQSSPDEQFDLIVRNKASREPWNKERGYFIVECKNWSSKVDRAELDVLYAKLERRHDRGNLGFLVSVNGFTAGVHTAQLAARKDRTMVVLVDGKDLERLVETKDRDAVLADLHQRTIVARTS